MLKQEIVLLFQEIDCYYYYQSWNSYGLSQTACCFLGRCFLVLTSSLHSETKLVQGPESVLKS